MQINELKVGMRYVLKYGDVTNIWRYTGGVKNIHNKILYHFKREDGKGSWFTIKEVVELKPYENV